MKISGHMTDRCRTVPRRTQFLMAALREKLRNAFDRHPGIPHSLKRQINFRTILPGSKYPQTAQPKPKIFQFSRQPAPETLLKYRIPGQSLCCPLKQLCRLTDLLTGCHPLLHQPVVHQKLLTRLCIGRCHSFQHLLRFPAKPKYLF